MADQQTRGLIIGGPTGSGKSSDALKIAQERGGVIINADSLQLYQGLPLLTAQPSEEDKTQIPHFLYEVFDVTAPLCSAQKWAELVVSVVEREYQNGAFPIIVGGTGFYLQALTQGLSPLPDVPKEILETLACFPLINLVEELEQVDPQILTKIQPQDRQRVIRALSMWKATGKPLSYWQAQPRLPFPYTFEVQMMDINREVLNDRLEKRLDEMIAQGAFEEVKKLKETLLKKQCINPPVTRAIGFHEISLYWQGELTKVQAIQKTLEKTRQYAKRQRTWFRHQHI